jgi:hypothetical protein
MPSFSISLLSLPLFPYDIPSLFFSFFLFFSPPTYTYSSFIFTSFFFFPFFFPPPTYPFPFFLLSPTRHTSPTSISFFLLSSDLTVRPPPLFLSFFSFLFFLFFFSLFPSGLNPPHVSLSPFIYLFSLCLFFLHHVAQFVCYFRFVCYFWCEIERKTHYKRKKK